MMKIFEANVDRASIKKIYEIPQLIYDDDYIDTWVSPQVEAIIAELLKDCILPESVLIKDGNFIDSMTEAKFFELLQKRLQNEKLFFHRIYVEKPTIIVGETIIKNKMFCIANEYQG